MQAATRLAVAADADAIHDFAYDYAAADDDDVVEGPWEERCLKVERGYCCCRQRQPFPIG